MQTYFSKSAQSRHAQPVLFDQTRPKMDIHLLLRRLQAGEKDRSMAHAFKFDRATVAKYRAWAEVQHLFEGPSSIGLRSISHAGLKGKLSWISGVGAAG